MVCLYPFGGVGEDSFEFLPAFVHVAAPVLAVEINAASKRFGATLFLDICLLYRGLQEVNIGIVYAGMRRPELPCISSSGDHLMSSIIASDHRWSAGHFMTIDT